MLRVTNLTRNYGSFRAVDRVSFELPKGKIVGLLGHNGAGKTTIMKIISGYMEADSGLVELDGVPLAGNEKRLQQQIGYLPESLPVYPDMSVADYLDYCAELKGIRGEDKAKEIRRVVQATDLTEKFVSPIADLSRGYKQRVGVAQAVLGKPKLLILDEPTNGLDPEQTAHMRKLIRTIAQDATVILSTHIMQEVEALCEQVLILRQGALVVDHSLTELKTSHELTLECSLEPADVEQFKEISGVMAINQVAPLDYGFSYCVHISEQAKAHKIASAIAQKCFALNAEIYRLSPTEVDLEKLFFDVTESVEVSDAA